jgi:cell wall-associated NlpC family hydrolase
MNIRDKILDIARKEVGYIEQAGNKTKYGKWFGLDGVPWCGMFVSWVYAKAGVPLPKIGFTKGFAGCQTAYEYFKRKGMVTASPKQGDIVLFDFTGDGRFDHTGIFICFGSVVNKVQRIYSIEGNTSLKNQANGGQVMDRIRTGRQCVFVNVLGD